MAHYLELSVSGESLTLPLVGSYTGTIETYAGVITNISGTGQRVITGATLTQITKITATDSNGSHHYNPTLSAEAGGTLLIDEVGGNHGTLNGFSSSNPFVYYYDFLNPSEEDTTNDNCLVFENSSNHLIIDNLAGVNTFKFKLAQDLPTPTEPNASFFDGRKDGSLTTSDGSDSWFSYYSNGSFTWGVDITNVKLNGVAINRFAPVAVSANDVIELTCAASASPTVTIGNKFDNLKPLVGLALKSIEVFSGGNLVRFYDFNRTAATAPVVPELINGQNGTMVGGATYEPIIDTVTFTTGDYATLPLFVTAESANSDYREYLAGTTAGATISGFSDGVIINGGTVTSPITLTQTGIAQIKNATCDDIDATGATGDVTIIDCEVEDVTG